MKLTEIALLFVMFYSASVMAQNKDIEEVFVNTEIECREETKGLFGDLFLSDVEWNEKALEYCKNKCNESGLEAKVKQTTKNSTKFDFYREQFRNQFCGVKNVKLGSSSWRTTIVACHDGSVQAHRDCNNKCDESGLEAKVKQTTKNSAKFDFYREQFRNQFCGVKSISYGQEVNVNVTCYDNSSAQTRKECNNKCDVSGLEAKVKQTTKNSAKFDFYREQFRKQFCGVKSVSIRESTEPTIQENHTNGVR